MSLCNLCFHGDVCGDRRTISFDVENKLIFCNDFKSREEYVKVVRCKDCKHYSKDGNWCHRNSHFDDDVYSMNWNDFGDDDFCSYGERKADQ